jgi:hypothetical protein
MPVEYPLIQHDRTKSMRITDEHLAALVRDGYCVVRGFLSRSEVAAAAAGARRLFAPDFDGWVAAGRRNPIDRPQELFPWDDSGLNHAYTHPDLIDAAERITGTRDLRLCEAKLKAKYAGHDYGALDWHIDYRNNTLGPPLADRELMLRHPSFVFYFNDVGPGDAPIRMRRHGDENGPGEFITGPAGTLVIYTIYTVHAASEFTDPRGHRLAGWGAMYDMRRHFDLPRLFTYKSGASEADMARFIREASPRQLQLLGFPPPGDGLWTPDYIAGMEDRYPGFDGEPYRAAAGAVGCVPRSDFSPC